MEHKKIYEKLSPFIDNELNSTETGKIKEHLMLCRECAEEYERLIEVGLKLHESDTLIPTAAFRAKINESINAQKQRQKYFNVGKFIPVPIAISFLVLMFSAFMVTAPLIYGMANPAEKAQVKKMAVNTVFACACGGVFSPVAFAKFCGVCTENACGCSKNECGTNCQMKTGGCRNGK